MKIAPFAVIVSVALALAAPAAGDVVREGPGRAELDWTAGLIVAVGAAAADLRAPRPEVARLAAERSARAAARRALGQRARAVELADGRTVGEVLDDDEGAQLRLERALARARSRDVDYASDGSVVVTAGLPLEAVRLSLRGAPSLVEPAREVPSGIVVDARGILEEPVLGLSLTLGDAEYEGPVVFHDQLGQATEDPRLGSAAVPARARERRGSALILDPSGTLDAAALARAGAAGVPVAVVIGEKS